MTEETRDGRDGQGKFTRKLTTAQRDAAAAAARGKGRTFDEIAAEFGFANRGAAYKAVQRAFAAIPFEGADEAKRLDFERTERLIGVAWDIMERPHLTVSQGKVVGKRVGWERDESTGEILRDAEGAPIGKYEDVLDDGPALAAIGQIKGLLERRARMTGYDAPSRSRIEVIDDDAAAALTAEAEREIARLAQEADPGDGLPGEPGEAG